MIEVLNDLIADWRIEYGREPDEIEVRYLARSILRDAHSQETA